MANKLSKRTAKKKPVKAAKPAGKRYKAREDFITQVSSIGADTKTGAVVLSHSAVRAIAGKLRERIKKDVGLRRRFYANPREVLGSVGLNEETQSEILRVDHDFKMKDSPFVDPRNLSFCFCTDCCCTGCCLTCWSTNKFDLSAKVSNPAP